MQTHFRYRACAFLALALILSSGCALRPQPKPAYQSELFTPYSAFQHHIDADPTESCQYARKALLSQGYLLEREGQEVVYGSKFFQPESDHQMRLELTLVCLKADVGTQIFASAVHTRYELKTSLNSSGISVSGIGSITLPWIEGKDSLVKTGQETVSDPQFYQRLFSLVDTFVP